jgi:glyoxylase-like metal-dependent hydrolase (beta-lactamase superfamily II)
MSCRIHHIVTGEVEASLGTTLLNDGLFSGVDPLARLPYGFREDIRRGDGSTAAGTMVPVPIWYIEGSDRRVLIDAGLPPCDQLAAVLETHHTTCACRGGSSSEVQDGLAHIGLVPADIEVVLLTHLHYDHIGHVALFENARFIVQAEEIAIAAAPPAYAQYYFTAFSRALDQLGDRLEVVEGDQQVSRGVRALRVGGHSPGCMAILVDTAAGVVALTGDIAYSYRNLELNWPPGVFHNLEELMRAYDRLRAEATILVPNHDWEVRTVHGGSVIPGPPPGTGATTIGAR